MKINGHLEWNLKYVPGTLEAIGYKNGKRVLREVVKTTGESASLQLVSLKTALKANGEDIAIITVSVNDKNNLPVPVANDEVIFNLSGPGKIIGVGNGNPTSLEKERFLDDIKTTGITDLQEKPIPSIEAGIDALQMTDTSKWTEAFKNRDYKNLAAAYAYRGSFELPQNFTQTQITFFYQSIGTIQSIYINGKEIGKNLPKSEQGNTFVVPHSIVQPGKNRVDIITTPIGKKYDWDFVNDNPGTIQIFTPAPAWKRKLFNGLAQIIIQTTNESGEIILEATGRNVKPATLKLNSVPTVTRDFVR
jgi:beta-galactosidase